MGAAVKGGGAVGRGPKNRVTSSPSMKTGKVVMAAKGGAINQHKQMAMGKAPKKGKVRRMRMGGYCG
jgi:hypothetical protein